MRIVGHAIEARVYAEDPQHDFRPDPGRIAYLAEPAPSRHVRVDSGVRENDEVSPYYDPMIAKLICWDEHRALAIRRINRALEEYRVVGVATNLLYLANILDSRPFVSGQLSTGFVEEHRHLLLDVNPVSPQRFLALATLYLVESQARSEEQRTGETADPRSPWASLRAWRLNSPATRIVRLVDGGGHEHLVGVVRERDGYRLDLEHQEVLRATARLERPAALRRARRPRPQGDHHGQRRPASPCSSATRRTPSPCRVAPSAADEESAEGQLVAPINGIVVSVQCREGDKVTRGTPLMVIEAMKMQHTIAAPRDGVVREVPYEVGDQVQEGQPLLVLDG